MVNTGDGSSAVKVTSFADAPFDGASTSPAPDAGSRVVAAKTFEQIKAEMKAKAAKLPAEAPKPVTKPEPKTEPKTEAATTVDGITDAEMTEFVAKSKERSATKAKAKAPESDPGLQLAKDIAAAVAAGDHLKAATLAKIDVNKLNDQAIAAADPAKPKTPEQEELAQLRAIVNELQKAIPKPAVVDARAKGREAAADDVAKDATKYPNLAKDRTAIVTALREAETQYDDLANEKKRALTKDETDRLINACLTKADAEAAATKAAPPTKHTSHSATPSPPSQRQQPNLSSSKSLSFDDAKARIWRK